MRPAFPVLVSAFTVLCPVLAEAADSDVKVSSIGYLPSRVKRASVTAAGTQFNLVRDADGTVAYSGSLGTAKTDPDTGERIAVAVFSSAAATTPPRRPGPTRTARPTGLTTSTTTSLTR